jgi:hypothetical protein
VSSVLKNARLPHSITSSATQLWGGPSTPARAFLFGRNVFKAVLRDIQLGELLGARAAVAGEAFLIRLHRIPNLGTGDVVLDGDVRTSFPTTGIEGRCCDRYREHDGTCGRINVPDQSAAPEGQ